jgi:RHS repeat-associated protein
MSPRARRNNHSIQSNRAHVNAFHRANSVFRVCVNRSCRLVNWLALDRIWDWFFARQSGADPEFRKIRLQVELLEAKIVPSVTAVNQYYNDIAGETVQVQAPGVLTNDTTTAPPLSASLVSGPSYGTATIVSSGLLQYRSTAGSVNSNGTLNLGFVGTDSLVYQAKDANNETADATAYIDVTDTAPTVSTQTLIYTDAENVTLQESAADGVLAASGASDVNGDTLLTVIPDSPGSSTYWTPLSGSSFPTAEDGTLWLTNYNGKFTYRPATNYSGWDSFTFAAWDGSSIGFSPLVTVYFDVGSAAIPTSTTVSSSNDPSTYGQSVTFTAAVTSTIPTESNPGSGTVTFYDGGTAIGSSSVNSSGVATLTTSSLSVGSQSITAVYGGATGYTGSSSSAITQTVNQVPTTTTLSFDPGSTIAAGETVEIDATVTPTSPNTGTPVGTVTFTATNSSLVNTPLGTETLTAGTNEATTFVDATLAAGVYTIMANYSGNTNFTSSYTTQTLTVSPPAGPVDQTTGTSTCSCSGPAEPTAGASSADTSDADVDYADGTVKVTQEDLSSEAFGTPFGETWTWTNASGYSDSISGSGGTQTQAPHLVQVSGNDSIAMVANASSAYFFDLVNGTYVTRFGYNLSLATETIGGQGYFVVTDGSGDTFTFLNYGSGTPAGEAGELSSMTDPNGDATTVTAWSSTGAPTQVEQTSGSGSSEETQAFNSTYLSSGPNTGKLSSVTQETQTGTGPWTTVGTTYYTYYTNSNNYGQAGEMMTAITDDSSGNLLSADYYRYYTSGSSAGLMEYSFGTSSYELLTEALGTGVDSLTNSQVAPYANTYYEYNSSGQVSEAVDAGAGCSVCSGGLGTFSYSYSTNANFGGVINPNVWVNKAVETLPDGNENIVYTNYTGQTMLSVYEDTTTDQQWCTYYQYNSAGQVILEASPSAVTGYSQSDPDLVGWSGGSATYLSSSSGLITTYTYPTITTATSSSPGNVVGYLEEISIQQGTSGSPIPQASYTYISNTAGGTTVYEDASDTVYRNSNGTGAETTSYSYTFYSGTNQIYSQTTTLPVILTSQNGSGTANTTTTVYDQFGRVIWTKDAVGFIDYTKYDPATGTAIEQIQDVNTSDTSEFSNLPSGWTTPTGGGLNLVTTYQVDSQGRVTEQTNPNGTVDYWVYEDANNEVREYTGWNSSTDTATGPTQVTIDDLALGYTETLTMTATPAVSGGVPTGTESIADIQSMSRSYTNDAGQVIEEEDYFNLSGLTYSSGAMGTSGVNYYATLYAYDSDGNLDRTVSPQGTITRTVYDGQHREVSEWIGTDDTPSSGYWSPTNNTSPSNMVETSSYVYDNGGVGDGDLTQVTQYPSGSAANRVTDYWYNWEDQKVAEKDGVSSNESDGVNRPLTVYTYDNLNDVTESQIYSGDGETPSISGGVLSLPGGISSDLQAEAVTSYDNQGNVYQTQEYSVNPTTGAVSSSALTTNNYYDADGNLIAQSAPGGLWTKYSYDGAGRQVMEYQTDGLSGTSYADAGSVSGDTVLSQTQTVYDGDGNVTETVTRDRFNTDSSTSYGALGTPTTGVEARVYYEGNYYDLADRLTASVDVGTNGGTAWTMPGSVPSRSSTVLVTSYSYAADAVQTVKLTGSPTGGTFTLTFGGYTTSSIAYNASASTVQSDLAALTSIGSGNVVVTQAVDGGWEVRFMGSLAGVYQNQMAASGSLTGGTSPSVSVATTSLGGDAGNVVDTTDPDDIDSRTYSDPLGRAVQTIQDFTNGAVTDDSNQTTDYTYNSVGKTSLTAEFTGGVGETTTWLYGVTTGTGSTIDSNDIVSTTEQPNPTTGLPDSSIETIVDVDALGETLNSTDPDGTTHAYYYDVLGQQTSDEASTLGSGVDGSIRLITTSYTTLGNPYLTTSYNAVSGGSIVNQVEDVYNGLDQLTQEYQSVSGAVNTSTTPSVQYIYSLMASGANNSRLTEIIYPDGYTVDYNYSSGLNNNISRLSSLSDFSGTLESYLYLGLNTVVEMDHPESGINLTYISQTGGTGSAGDQYVGLDQFGRVIDQNWYDPTTTSSVVNLEYGYDDDGNVLYRNDTINTAFGELYTYDGLGQITSFERGTLNSGDTSITGTPSVDETWTYDPLGNHTSDTTNGTTVISTFNYQNQIASMSGSTTPVYDADGNTTTDQSDLKYVYDAWGRLVTVKNSGGTTLEIYSYDGLNDRMTNTVGSTTTELYNSTSGQVLEEDSGGMYKTRYVWSPGYVNEMIFRDTDTSGSGLTATGTSYQRLFVLQDANFNVIALVNTSGSVVERYVYDPFGAVTVLTGSYGSRSGSSYSWVYGFQGGRLDTVTGDNLFGARNEDPATGTWTSPDPVGFAGGDNDLYGLEGNNPVGMTDPTGLATGKIFVFGFEGGGAYASQDEQWLTNEKEIGNKVVSIINAAGDKAVFQTVWWFDIFGGAKLIGAINQMKDDAKRCQKDAIELVGYSYGGQTLINAIQDAFFWTHTKVQLVFTVDPIARRIGLPLGNLAINNASTYAQNWFNYYQTLDQGETLVIRGRKVVLQGSSIPGAINVEVPAWAFKTPAAAHGGIISDPVMRGRLYSETASLAQAVWEWNNGGPALPVLGPPVAPGPVLGPPVGPALPVLGPPVRP